ncbi:NAD(P)H:quinone oxidoreductase [Stappia aggregata IAM 12614]|uniref:NAD(P)H:quinone oxidoreductase n=1 Tax=Roseibium aggregatum (strain ATCC 25650 / DSM 13394 / JCM 20685 / NBRC 16684 / NCIMB 2208 / IAM 12614 / B1) TaxID=384765 RepID=A0P313_ROSAI|nr:SDR family oxidoreductase [Roseibium aggregatum]EAV40622.1 NAD(P)H:quinone oxidoreductase [Stappia aggregata IAM 12614] [Roseibium aggregatum IAM 12614]
MIAVTGANGQLGRLVLKHLAKLTAQPVRALVRSPEKAADLASGQVAVVKADYDDSSTLPAALEGVERLLLISGSEVGKRVPQHKAVIDAAKAAGVRFIVYTSLLNVPQSSLLLGEEHKETEKLLSESGIAHAVLRNGWYVENFGGTISAALAHGAVAGASGDGKFSAAGREDYAEAAARIVSGSDLSTRALELGGSSAFTLGDLAAELSSQTGRDIPFNNLPDATYAGILVQAGLPEGFAKILADADRGASEGDLFTASTALEDLNGHPARSLKDFVAESLKANA